MSTKSKIVFAALLTFSLTCLFITGLLRFLGIGPSGADVSRFDAATRIVDSSYIGEYDREKAEDAAIRAYLAEIGDPYANYYDGESAASFKNTINGEYVGIGVEVYADTAADKIVVLAAYNGGPARRAGVKSGDVITAVDGKPYSAAEMNDAVEYMKGSGLASPIGTELTLSLLRGGENVELTLARDNIDLYRIETSEVGDSLLYVQYTGFSEGSAKKLSELLKKADGKYKGIVMDLRENPGGSLDAAVDICDMFLDGGLIMYTEDKNGARTEYHADSESVSLPLAVLVDEASASASEVVAGCIQARGRGVIIGEKTFGKGVSQMIFAIGQNGEMMKITGYKNYRPDGRWLDEAVTPDIEAATEAVADEYGNVSYGADDAALAAAIDALN